MVYIWEPGVNKVREEILRVLRDAGGVVSGQRLCEDFGVSRAAISKHVRELRKLGYEIESVPRLGHRLVSSTDLPIEIEVSRYLKTSTMGRHYVFEKEMPSTNSFLGNLVVSKCHDGMVVVADRQTGGRGRMQRTWHSPAGVNLYFSVLLQPPKSPSDIPELALVAAWAVVRAISAVAPTVEAGVKWPNDVLVGGRKLAGILCEMQAETDVIHKVILGIGLNVNLTRKQVPADLRKRATSLRMETGDVLSRPRVMGEILNSLEKGYRRWLKDGLGSFLPELEERSVLTGKKVRVRTFGKRIEGTVAGMSTDGGLVLKEGRKKRTVYSGEVTLVRPRSG
jgi:BirA family biotin operon repressor/biotin-[acetyl-CoA-carboxylase] ligase